MIEILSKYMLLCNRYHCFNFLLQGNKLEAETTNDSVRDTDLATAPLNIHPSVKVNNT